MRTMPGGGSVPSCCAFTHRVAFEEGSGPQVLLKGRPGNRGRSACGPTHVARLEFPRETGLILRGAGKAGNPFQTTQGNRLSCRDQEGGRGSEEAVPGPSVFPSGDPMNHSTPGLPVHHQLPEFTQTHVHQVSDAIQPSHPLSSPSSPAPNPSQHQSLFQCLFQSLFQLFTGGGQSTGVSALASFLPKKSQG